jgi:hypothetical protein
VLCNQCAPSLSSSHDSGNADVDRAARSLFRRSSFVTMPVGALRRFGAAVYHVGAAVHPSHSILTIAALAGGENTGEDGWEFLKTHSKEWII